MLQVVDHLEGFLFRSSVRRLLSIGFLLTVFKSGIWYLPNLIQLREVAENPFENTLEYGCSHLFWNWLGPFLAWVLGIHGLWPLFCFHLLFSFAFTALVAWTIFRRLPEREARVSWILFLILPVSGTAYYWVGTDSITLFLMAAAVAFPRSRWAPLALGMALGMEHFEQAFFAAGGALAMLVLSRRSRTACDYRPAWALLLLIGVVAGKLLLAGLFACWQVQLSSGRLDWLSDHLASVLRHFFLHIHFCIWSVLGVGWLAAIKYAERGREAWPFLAVLFALLLVLLPVSDDQTRVLAIVTFPLIAICWLLHGPWLATLDNRLLSWMFLIWLVMPWAWVWGGLPRCSMLTYGLACLFGRLTGWFHIPSIDVPPFL